jgi:hypothetical protein
MKKAGKMTAYRASQVAIEVATLKSEINSLKQKGETELLKEWIDPAPIRVALSSDQKAKRKARNKAIRKARRKSR